MILSYIIYANYIKGIAAEWKLQPFVNKNRRQVLRSAGSEVFISSYVAVLSWHNNVVQT